jgi:hypothetical protein
MTSILQCAVHESRRKPLAACVASLFALTAPAATLAATVTSCLDDGTPGTLRKVIESAAEDDTVLFTGLDCTSTSSKITLSDFAIPIPQNSLTIVGFGAKHPLTIDASALPRGYADSRVFTHGGNGTLGISGLTLSGGYVYHNYFPASGGCLSSAGNVVLYYVTVTQCVSRNYGYSYNPQGGAVFTQGNLTLNNSYVSFSQAKSGALSALGGGVFVYDDLSLQSSNIKNNSANAGSGSSLGGGAYVHGALTLDSSELTNTATSSSGLAKGGGAYVRGNLTLNTSIVSFSYANCSAGAFGGGVFANGDLIIQGSLMRNNAANADSGSSLGGGVYAHGNLTLDSSTVEANLVTSTSSFAKGAGAYVVGNLSASNMSFVWYNEAISTSGAARGGGMFAKGSLTLDASTVARNTASGFGSSFGGGAYVLGDSSISYATISNNKVTAYFATTGGGLLLKGANHTITSSTISNNSSNFDVGGVGAIGSGAGLTFELKNSTISNNSAGKWVGGIYADSASVKLWNSTIAFNAAGDTASGVHSPGVQLGGSSNAVDANLHSTLISNNFAGSYQLDLGAVGVVAINGFLPDPANNLVRATLLTLPPDTKQRICPHLGPLRNNGGLTFTHALMSKSAAIDAGNGSSLPYDQRGSAAVNGKLDYPRVSGNGAVADIGAFEVQQDNIVFNTDFEDCPPLSF